MLAAELPDGYATRLADSSSFGEALLAPSLMYVPLVQRLLEHGVPVAYLSHITGHGFLKLMRPRRELTYRIERLGEVPPVLSFMVERAGLDARSAYSTFNMGSGFAVYCAAGSGGEVVRHAETLGLTALVAGGVEDGPRRVVVEPVGVAYEGAELELSA
jgi:phosphoribosylformylglycinamidine cyclo-ligase